MGQERRSITLDKTTNYQPSSSMINPQDTIPGFFLIQDIEFVRKSKGEGAVTKLAEIMKDDLVFKKISAIKRYSINTEIKLIRESCKLIFGDDSIASWQKWGSHDFETVRQSPLGKVMLALSRTPIDAIRNGAKLFAFFNPAINYSYQNLNDHSVLIIIKNNPYPKEYFSSLFEAFIKQYPVTYTLTVTEDSYKNHLYRIEWKEKEEHD